jgi:hypothetical protein
MQKNAWQVDCKLSSLDEIANNLGDSVSKCVNENYQKMPNINDQPFMEPHLLSLYRQTHLVTLLNLYNVSIVMQGVLLETLVKEIIYVKEKIDFEKPFGPAIERCRSKSYLDQDELDFLTKFKDTYRNNYQHMNIKKITNDQKLDGWAIPLDPKDVGGSLLRGIDRIMHGKAGDPQPIGYNDVRAVGQVIKETYDKSQALLLFIEVDKFFREMLGKYLPPNLHNSLAP